MKTNLLFTAIFIVIVSCSTLFGQTNYAIYLNGGSNAYVETNLKATYSTFGNWTIECWVQGNSAPSRSRYDGPIYGESIFAMIWDHWDDSFVGHVSTRPQYLGDYYIASLGALNGGQWYHMAATFDGSTMKTYVNGQLIQTISGIPAITNSDELSLKLGAHPEPSYGTMSGYLDEVRIWTVARTQTEIQSNMFKYLSGSETGLWNYWKFDEGSGTSAADVKNRNNGTLASGASFTTSSVPFGNQTMQLQTDLNAIWKGSESNASGGLILSRTFSSSEYAVFGHDNGSGLSTADLPEGTVTRANRVWYLQKSGTVSSTSFTFDLSVMELTATASTADNYTLLYRSGTSGTFSEVKTASSITNTDQIIFSDVSISDGYYTIGTKDNVVSPLPVELVSFTSYAEVNGVFLHWRTATEVNNYGFEVERRSTSSSGWEVIGFVKGAGTSNAPKEYTYTDCKVPAGRYEYRLKQIDLDGAFKYSESVEIEIAAPREYALNQNFPNPFNPSTVISYAIPVDGMVTLKVYDMLGKEVATLVNEQQPAGSYEVQFNASQLASGVYFYKLQAVTYSSVKKLLLLK